MLAQLLIVVPDIAVLIVISAFLLLNSVRLTKHFDTGTAGHLACAAVFETAKVLRR